MWLLPHSCWSAVSSPFNSTAVSNSLFCTHKQAALKSVEQSWLQICMCMPACVWRVHVHAAGEPAAEGKEGQHFIAAARRSLKQMQWTLRSSIQLCKLKLQAWSRVASYLQKTSEVYLSTEGLAHWTVSHSWSNRALWMKEEKKDIPWFQCLIDWSPVPFMALEWLYTYFFSVFVT